jgi:hypothetical protein
MKRALFLIFALVALLLGGLGVVNELRILQRAHASASWPVVKGVFQTVKANNSSRRSTPGKWLAVHYAYEVDGVRYASHNLWPPATLSGMSESEVDRLALQWTSGGPALVSYDPADHAASAVLPGLVPGMIGNLLLALGAFAGGAVMLYLEWPRKAKPRPNT